MNSTMNTGSSEVRITVRDLIDIVEGFKRSERLRRHQIHMLSMSVQDLLTVWPFDWAKVEIRYHNGRDNLYARADSEEEFREYDRQAKWMYYLQTLNEENHGTNNTLGEDRSVGTSGESARGENRGG